MIDPVAAIAFAKVAEAKSFTVAAQELGVSKGSISKLINKLEISLKTKLLYRTTRRLSLTETGQAFLTRASQFAEIIAEAEQAVAHLEAEPRGLLRVSAPVSFGHRHLASVVAAYLARNPGVSIDLSLADRFVDLVEEGYDLAIRIGVLRDSSLTARTIGPFRPVLCASPTYLAASGMPRRPGDLAEHNCLIYTLTTTPPDRWIFEGPEGREQVKVRGTLRASNGDVLRSAAVAGLGILASPDFIVADALRERALVPILADYRLSDGGAGIYVVYPPNRRLSPKVRTFVDFLARSFANPDWRDEALANRRR